MVKMNVKFLFENINIENLSCLKNQNIDLIFNATGNRFFQNKSVDSFKKNELRVIKVCPCLFKRITCQRRA